MKNGEDKNFLSTSELADILGISRVGVYKKIKRGEMKAEKVGDNQEGSEEGGKRVR